MPIAARARPLAFAALKAAAALIVTGAALFSAGETRAQSLASPCFAFAEAAPPDWEVKIHRAALNVGPLGELEVGVTFIGHSTFLIQTPQGVTIATDYAGWAGPDVIPTVVTMNNAHETHFTNNPNSAIEHVLRGWNPAGGPAEHDLEVEDVRIRNVPTDVVFFGDNRIPDGNSIFVFEVADLCIGHLGHLHHEPTLEDFGLIGFLDVVMVPVDGVYTTSQEEMIRILTKLRARVILPMHSFGPTTLQRFLDGVSVEFPVTRSDTPTVILSDATLPAEPTVLVLPPYSGFRYFGDD